MRLASLSLLVLAAACGAGAVVSAPLPAQSSCTQGGDIAYAATSKVDLLFVLDDGPTMAVKLATWRAALPALVDGLTATASAGRPASYHLGVITSDLGAGETADPAIGCRPGGDGALLRATADMTGGVRYIDDDQLAGTSNVPDVAATLAALSDVGTAGCAFPQPLEAAYRALHDPSAGNAGFLRSDAILVVLFVTDGDDCSAPATSDVFAGGDRFACTQFGIACNGAPVPPAEASGLSNCQPLAMENGGKLFDVERYTGFFTRPAAQGGVKVDPNDVILAAVAGPRDPLGVRVTTPCAADPTRATCATLEPSCVAIDDVRYAGTPAIRLTTVVAAAKNERLASICAADDTGFVRQLLPTIAATALGPACLAQPVAARVDGTPDCVVTDVTTNPDGSTISARSSLVRREQPHRPVLAEARPPARLQQRGLLPLADSVDVQAAAELPAGPTSGPSR